MLLYEGVEACKVERQIAALRRGGADERLGLAPPGDPRFADPLADAEIFRINAAGQLLEIGGKTTRIEDIEGQYVGLLKFTPSHGVPLRCYSVHSTLKSAIAST